MALLMTGLLAGCAGPPLTLYTLNSAPLQADRTGLGGSQMVVAIARVALPAELDGDDLLRRWACGLANEITDRLTADLAARRPEVLVTDAPRQETPAYRIVVTLSRFDVSADGDASVSADWTITPGDPGLAVLRDRTLFTVLGPVATDLNVVTLQRRAVDRLSQAIAIDHLK
jgi:uncharacterized lipoprotein YmbA